MLATLDSVQHIRYIFNYTKLLNLIAWNKLNYVRSVVLTTVTKKHSSRVAWHSCHRCEGTCSLQPQGTVCYSAAIILTWHLRFLRWQNSAEIIKDAGLQVVFRTHFTGVTKWLRTFKYAIISQVFLVQAQIPVSSFPVPGLPLTPSMSHPLLSCNLLPSKIEHPRISTATWADCQRTAFPIFITFVKDFVTATVESGKLYIK